MFFRLASDLVSVKVVTRACHLYPSVCGCTFRGILMLTDKCVKSVYKKLYGSSVWISALHACTLGCLVSVHVEL